MGPPAPPPSGLPSFHRPHFRRATRTSSCCAEPGTPPFHGERQRLVRPWQTYSSMPVNRELRVFSILRCVKLNVIRVAKGAQGTVHSREWFAHVTSPHRHQRHVMDCAVCMKPPTCAQPGDVQRPRHTTAASFSNKGVKFLAGDGVPQNYGANGAAQAHGMAVVLPCQPLSQLSGNGILVLVQ